MDKKMATNHVDQLHIMRHSSAHLLAYAVTSLFPDTKVAIGPVIDTGFYYDFDFATPIAVADIGKIEQKMRELKNKKLDFKQDWLSIEDANTLFKDEPYKLEIISEIEEGDRDDFGHKGKVSIYRSGDFADLCKGPHVDSSTEIGYFTLLTLAGAYWKGSEKNKMLTRIYGTCFPTKKELDKYLWQIEEAKKRDHRLLGEKLELFTISDKVGPGLILWLPKGNIIKEELEAWAKKTEYEQGYQRVTTPHITKSGLYYTSGHLPYYKDDMYPSMKLDDEEEYFLKPMNCPHHHMIYASKPKSYRDLPIRLAEYGDVYRFEASGQLFGLMRVRGMSQNDAHIYCTEEQAVEEFVKVMQLHEYYYKNLGITDYHLELALRDPKNTKKYHGNEAMWKRAEELMRKAVAKINIRMVESIGNAAFYGPKIDFIIHSAIGREFAVSTNQIDLFMGKRFNLAYIDSSGKEQTPIIIHRAPLGSHERFIGFLIEHYGGAFPLWLSPVQVVIVPISEKHVKYANKLKTALSAILNPSCTPLRVTVDDRNSPMGAKVRDASLQKVPYVGIIGDKEMAQSELALSVRTRDGKNMGQLTISQFTKQLVSEIENKR